MVIHLPDASVHTDPEIEKRCPYCHPPKIDVARMAHAHDSAMCAAGYDRSAELNAQYNAWNARSPESVLESAFKGALRKYTGGTV